MLHIKRNGNTTYIHTFQKALQWVAMLKWFGMWPCFGNDYLIYCILDLNLAQNKPVPRASLSKVRL